MIKKDACVCGQFDCLELGPSRWWKRGSNVNTRHGIDYIQYKLYNSYMHAYISGVWLERTVFVYIPECSWANVDGALQVRSVGPELAVAAPRSVAGTFVSLPPKHHLQRQKHRCRRVVRLQRQWLLRLKAFQKRSVAPEAVVAMSWIVAGAFIQMLLKCQLQCPNIIEIASSSFRGSGCIGRAFRSFSKLPKKRPWSYYVGMRPFVKARVVSWTRSCVTQA